MLGVLEGQRYRKTGDVSVWIVEAVVADRPGRQHYAVLVRRDEAASIEVPLIELLDRACFQPLPADD